MEAPKSSSPTDNSKMVDIGTLLVDVLAATAAAAEVIRNVQREREAAGEASLRAVLKSAHNDKSWLTTADTAAQEAMLALLRFGWPSLRIVAEEDQGQPDRMAGSQALHHTAAGLPPDARPALGTPAPLRQVHLEDVCVFLDPVDGTGEFVRGNLQAVQVLAGVAVRGNPVAGVMAIPFSPWPLSDEQRDAPVTLETSRVHIIHGMVGAGVIGLPTARGTQPSLDSRSGVTLAVSASTASSPPSLLDRVLSSPALSPHRALPCPACGNKALAVLSGRAHMAVFNFQSSLWDTCATAALLEAAGGTLTDLFGCRIRHSVDSPVGNIRGVIMSCADVNQVDSRQRTHLQICHELMHEGVLMPILAPSGLLPVDEPQAADIARDIHGAQLTSAVLGEAVGCSPSGGAVEGYTVPEASAVRYKQSDAVRIFLSYREGAALEGGSRPPASAFLKRIVLRDMPYAQFKARHAPEKLRRDVKSCTVEGSFLTSEGCRKLGQLAPLGGPQLALPYRVWQACGPEDVPLDSAYALLLRDFSPALGWKQKAFFDDRNMRAALKALAVMHACFWRGQPLDTGSGPADHVGPEAKLRGCCVWESGCYWHLGQLPLGHVDRLVPAWEEQLKEFLPFISQAGGDVSQLASLGHRLRQHAEELHCELHRVAAVSERNPDLGHTPPLAGKELSSTFLTLIHGDPKAANFFFREKLSEAGCESSDRVGALPEVGLVDFQWTGWGAASVDIAYLVAASASPELIPLHGSESELLAYYYTCLKESLETLSAEGRRGSNPVEAATHLPPFSELERQYEAALLDLTRAVVAEQWPGLTLAKMEERRNRHSFNAYNRSPHHMAWLVTRADLFLRKRHSV